MDDEPSVGQYLVYAWNQYLPHAWTWVGLLLPLEREEEGVGVEVVALQPWIVLNTYFNPV